MMRDGETDREDSPQRNITAENHGHLRAGRSQEALRSAPEAGRRETEEWRCTKEAGGGQDGKGFSPPVPAMCTWGPKY